jgi:hypothetical protein
MSCMGCGMIADTVCTAMARIVVWENGGIGDRGPGHITWKTFSQPCGCSEQWPCMNRARTELMHENGEHVRYMAHSTLLLTMSI